MLEYSVEGESITPEEFEAGEWTSVLKAQDRFKKSLYGDNAESTPRETQAGSDGRKALGAEQVKRGRAPVRQKRRPFLKMPAKDFKVVCRPKNWDLSVVTPRELGSAMRAAAKLTSATAAEEDLVRVNETNNTMTPPGRQQSSEDKSQDGKEEQRSRPTERSSSGARDGNKSRDRSGSFPPLPGAGAGKAGGQGSSLERSANSANDTTKKVSWPNTGAPNETARERELKRQVQQQGDTIKKMEARMADMERALKGGKGQGVLAPVMQAPQKVAQAAGSRVQESSAMEVENRGPVKRPPPADEGTNAKRVAETSTADTPQPAFKVTSLKADVSALVDRVGKLEDRQDRLEARVGKIEARLDKIEERFDAFTNESRTFQTQVMDMFRQLHTLLEARLPAVVGQAPMGQVVDRISATGIDITAMEEASIALVIRNPRATLVLTDSQAAYRNFTRDQVGLLAQSILLQAAANRQEGQWKQLLSVPGHAGVRGNEIAHASTREHLHRVSAYSITAQLLADQDDPQPLLSYPEIH
ncbi:hypothetical protein HPB49_019145 [Dermacentor silvarum]|uniref:Uncharacterized protein n=1 Tax=Dermacentor silvarum TaxID=543639 RepID=A0ACB8DKD5_DERSI|nr:hypothetical protein HPB49_019145 [Dermacentor silvarum]